MSTQRKKRATPAQVALARFLVQKPGAVPIPGTIGRSHLVDKIGVAMIELTPDGERRIDSSATDKT